jgi:hypothetical protein
MNNGEVVNDFRRRYEGTYVFLKMERTGVETLVKVSRVEDSSTKIGILYLESPEYGALTLNLGSDGHHLKFKYPPVGVFQHGRDAFLFRRRPSRQYRRGICSDNSLMYNVTSSVVGPLSRWSAEEVQDAFNHKVSTPKQAFELLATNKARSVALDNNFSISKSPFETPDYVIWNWQFPVARISEKGVLGKVYEEVFRQDLLNIAQELK